MWEARHSHSTAVVKRANTSVQSGACCQLDCPHIQQSVTSPLDEENKVLVIYVRTHHKAAAVQVVASTAGTHWSSLHAGFNSTRSAGRAPVRLSTG